MTLANVSRVGMATLIAGIIILGVSATVIYTQKEYNRELARWQDKLNIAADSHARDVTKWVQTQFSGLTAVANNPSLQLYFLSMQPQPAAEANAPRPPAQADYLRNLLTTTAERMGFAPPAPAVEQPSRNLGKAPAGGLALLDINGNPLMATTAMPPLSDDLAAKIKSTPRGKAALLDIEQTADGAQQMGFVIPIYSVQAAQTAENQVGMLVGIRPINNQLTALLSTAPKSEKTLELALVRPEGDGVRYLTALLDQSPPMSKRETSVPNLAASYAIANPGSFAQKTDYRAQEVLVTGRAIASTPWTLIAKIDRKEALAASANWRRAMITTFLLSMTAIIATLIAVWRAASARRANEVSLHAQQLAAESESRARLLSLVANNQPQPLYIVDGESRVWFANDAATQSMKTTVDAAHGKLLTHVAGADVANEINRHCAEALASDTTLERVIQRTDADGMRTIATKFVPLQYIPLPELEQGTSGVLVTEQDVTELLNEREKRTHALHQLIALLVSLIDRRDPNAAQHSAHVAHIASAIARDLRLDALMVETTETAARLMNLGKVAVPAELLTRAGTLKPEERNALRNSPTASAALLNGITFEGPVTDTLRQVLEHVDGSGPLRLKGDAILISARILAAVNAAVGMLSPRAYRKPISVDEAIKLLQSNPQFDPRVVAALTNYLLNRAGEATLRSISRVPQAA